MSLERLLLEIKERAEKATPGPWEWRDRYDFREHIEHQKQGLDAECENIEAGRIRLEPNVLSEWAENAGDSGVQVNKDDARFIESARTDIPRLLAVIEKLREQRNEWANEANNNAMAGGMILLAEDAELLAILTGEAK